MDCLPAGVLTDVVRLALAVSLVVGYPCILFPVTEIMEEMLFTTSPLEEQPLLIPQESEEPPGWERKEASHLQVGQKQHQ